MPVPLGPAANALIHSLALYGYMIGTVWLRQGEMHLPAALHSYQCIPQFQDGLRCARGCERLWLQDFFARLRHLYSRRHSLQRIDRGLLGRTLVVPRILVTFTPPRRRAASRCFCNGPKPPKVFTACANQRGTTCPQCPGRRAHSTENHKPLQFPWTR